MRKILRACVVGLIAVCLEVGVCMGGGASANGLEADAFPRDVNWRQIRTDHFVIVFAEPHLDIAYNVAQLAESIANDAARFLDYAEIADTYVIISDHLDTFDLYTLSAIEDPLNDPIILHLRKPSAGNPAFGVRTHDWLALQFSYQYAHILRHRQDSFLRSLVGLLFPDFGMSGGMDCGMAVYIDQIRQQDARPQPPYFDMMLRAEMVDGTFSTLDQRTAAGLRTWPGDIGMFVYGASFLSYLAETYGMERLAQLNRQQNAQIPWPLFGGDAFDSVYGKPLSTLQEEWRTAIQEAYQAQIDQIRAQSLTHSEPLTQSGYFTHSPVFAPDGQFLYYIDGSPHEVPALMQLRLSDQTRTRLTEGYFSGDFSISPDGQRLYFCKSDVYDIFYEVSDLYAFDLATRQVQRLTTGARAVDPAISPDGETLVYVTTEAGSMQLMRLDLTTNERSSLLETADFSQIRHPVFSADGAKLAVQIWKNGGVEDIYVMNRDGSNLRAITLDTAVDSTPTWGLQDAYLFFSSDRTGVPNIFAYALAEDRLYQVTNVLTGAFDPSISPDGTRLVFERYSSKGLDIHLADLSKQGWQEYQGEKQRQLPLIPQVAERPEWEETRYRPLSSLLRMPSILPAWDEDEDGFQLGLTLSGNDILEQHAYALSVLYGLESGNASFDAQYLNTQFYPTIRLFGYDRPAEYSDLFVNAQGDDEDYWEQQQGGGIDVMMPLYRTLNTEISLLAGYEYQELTHLTDPDTLFAPRPDEGTLGKVSVGALWQHLKSAPYAIGSESGVQIFAEYTRNDEIFGSDYNIDEFLGEATLYVPSPVGRHHVLAVRALGGLSDGDTLAQGVFQLGGYTLNTQAALIYEPQIFLRGYEENAFTGDRVALGTVEYRVPIWFLQRTVWRGRILWDSIAGTAFFETGDAWHNADDEASLQSSAGVELTLNLGLRYGRWPLSLSLGFAQGFDEDTGESQVYGSLLFTL
ncbi:BamA/TamA family outer membrane protein [candidate division KSB3 bacterium]|uniref:BamA/TamA family outer membrane protein n=1 Tax=candidate division KSB3 bacterium TaxID=2044937 RepID=A0A9D5JWJ0_9BACT|nr:BamA/TamA family outer membrane protein [candidate division KSB3 bacterium]MBD3325266.1 BamA/TamA family outer membrane protein [candidate division KSB3 bacterium]